MSRQLAISAAFSTFAMAAFVLLATPSALSDPAGAATATGAAFEIAAPAADRPAPAWPLLDLSAR